MIWPAVLLAGLGTYALRASFLVSVDGSGDLPTRVETALGMVPPAVLAALVVPAVFAPDGTVAVADNPRLLAGAVAAATAWYTESVLATILVGLAVVGGLGVV